MRGDEQMRPKNRRMNFVLVTLAVLPSAAVRSAEPPAKDRARREQERRLIETLKGNASWAEKNRACRQLRVVGTRASIPALTPLLWDEKLSHLARYALEPMPYPEAGLALREALAKTNGKTKVGIINSLGFREDRQAVPELVKLLKGADLAVAAAAAGALGRAGTPEAANALSELRSSASVALRSAAAEASLDAAERLLRGGDRSAAGRIYEALRTEPWPNHVRLGAFVGLLAAQPEEAVPRAIAAITGKDQTLRAVAIANIATLRGETVAERIAAELPKLPAQTQVLLIGVLAQRDQTPVRKAILRVGQASTGEVRAAAARALGKVGDASCVAWLVQVATTAPARQEREVASEALVVLKADGVTGELAKLMAAADDPIRPQLIGLLAERNDRGAVDALLSQAQEPAVKVRRAAFRGLARLAEPSRLPGLIGLLVASPDDAARGEAEKAIAQVARRTPDESKRAEAVLKMLAETKLPAARCSLLRVLAGIGGTRALAAVREALDRGGEAERDAAVRALASWPDAEAAGALLAVCRKSSSRTHRVLALRGLVRVLGPQSGLPIAQLAKLYREAVPCAKSTDEKKMLLGGIALVGHHDALALAMAWIEDEGCGAEAALAAVKIAETVLASHRESTEAAMKKVALVARDPSVRKRAQELLRRVEQFKDFIVAWLASGPYSLRGRRAQQLFDVAFPAEMTSEQDAAWRPLPPRSRTKEPWMLDLAGTLGGEHCVGYVRTWIHSERDQAGRLEIGVDDGVKVWLGSKVVYGNNSAGAAVAGEEKVEVALKQGWNFLMLKIVQHTGPWEFCARLCSTDGGRLEGLRVDPTYEGPMPAIESPALKGRVAAGRARPARPPRPRRPKTLPSGKGWTPLFNGKDLTGWTETGHAIFKVEDGSLIGTQTTGKGGDLWHEAEWDDFELRATYRIVWPANSGLWFRHDGRRGYQYDILKWQNPVAYSGTLYCPGKMFLTKNLDESLENRDDWNEACIRAVGDELTLWLNGTQVGDCLDPTLQKGRIGIQVHGGDGFKGMHIIVKSIEIRPVRP